MKDQRIINVFMKRLWILIFFVVLPMYLLAQQKTEYNRKGDEAMKRLDYSDARMWYEEGVVQCDRTCKDEASPIGKSTREG